MFLSILDLILQYVLYFSLHLSGNNFPRPLPPKEELLYFERMANGDTEARDALICHNLRLVAHIIKKYYTTANDQDDLISIGTIGLIKAVDSFRHDKGVRFATYAARCIENEILMQFRAVRKIQNNVLLNDPLDTDGDGNSLTILDVIRDEFDICEDYEYCYDLSRVRAAVDQHLHGREKSVIELRFGLNDEIPLTQQQVADQLEISRSYVSRIEKKALESLRTVFMAE